MEDIQRIRREHGLDLNTTDEQAKRAVSSLRSNLSNSLRNLSEELYTKDLHFVLEFVQNADDNTYASEVTPTLEFELSDRLITIRCNETGFTLKNVEAICSVGKSTKKDTEGYIGEKGIGFKAVFTIADVVHVLSGDYAFKFDNSGSEELGMIAPIWTEEHTVEPRWTTFCLSIHPRVDLSSLSEKLAAVEPTLLLFLRKLRQLDIVVQGQRRCLSREDLSDGTTVLRSNDEENRYVMVKHLVTELPLDSKRPNVTTSEVVLAFPVSSSGEPVIYDQDVHTFLPLRSFGFSFIIQADFLSTANREDILSNRPWNSTLRDAVPTAFLEALIEFDNRPKLEYNWLRYVPCHVSDDFMKPIVDGIKQRIQLRGVDGDSHPPTSLIIVPGEYQTESSEPLVPEGFMGSLRYLNSGYNSTRDAGVLAHLGVKIMSADDFISGLRNMKQQLRMQDNKWLGRTCNALRSLANEWRSSHKGRIQNLCLVPLEGGSWDTARASDVFFVDASVSDVPGDLPMRFVRQYPSLVQEHRRLLEDLGVGVATAKEIADQILNRHLWNTPKAAMVLTHAKFLFHHTNRSAAELKVRCSDNVVRNAASVYMDFPFPLNKVPLSEVLEPHGAPFLHHEYYTAFYSGSRDAQRWFEWLRDTLKINVSPRFDGRNFCSEFWTFASGPSSPILQVLRDYWPLLSPKLSTIGAADALKRLSGIRVPCSDNQLHRLDETYLGRPALRRRFPDLLFINVENVESRSWDFLADLGVTFDVSCMFYLKRLIECSQGKRSVTLEEVTDLYGQISARFDDEGTKDRIRQAFRDHALIYLSSPASEGQSGVTSRWLTSGNVFWDGPRSIFSKPILAAFPSYHDSRKLFAEQLRIPSCPDDILLHELRVVEQTFEDRALTAEEHEQVFNILKDVDQAIPSERGSTAPTWLENLKTMAVFPATDSEGLVRLYKQGQIYNPLQSSERLIGLFSGRVPVLIAPGETRLGHLNVLLSSNACSGIKRLNEEVHKEIVHSADRDSIDVPLSKQYTELLGVLKRIVLWRRRKNPPGIGDLTDLIVYESKELFCRYVLGDIRTDLEPQTIALEIDQGGTRLVVWRCRSGQDRGDDFEFATAFANQWKIDVEVVFMAITSPDAYIALHGIPSLASLKDRPGHPPAVLSVCPGRVESKAINTVNSIASQVAAVPSPSPTSVKARQQPSFEIEWANLVRNCDAELHLLAQNGSLSSTAQSLEGLFDDLSIQPSSQAPSCDGGLYRASNMGGRSRATVDINAPFLDIPIRVPPQYNARENRNSDSEIPRNPHATSFMPISEDFTTGALGELWLFYLLSSKLPQFTEDNWTSELRYHASGHRFGQYTGVSLADFCYEDTTGALTKILLGEGSSLARTWSTRYPRYYLEVKSTVGDQHTPFHFSRNQLRMMSAMTVRNPDTAQPEDVYVLVRVWNVHRNDLKNIRCEAYLDPHKLLYTGELWIDSEDGVSVVIRE